MRAVLEFDLPEDERDFTLAANARRLSVALAAVARHLRDRKKYGELSEESYDELEDVQMILRDAEVDDLLDP